MNEAEVGPLHTASESMDVFYGRTSLSFHSNDEQDTTAFLS